MSEYAEESELLEYETEAPERPEPIQPVPVYVTEPVVTIATVPQHVTCSTVVLTAAQPYALILANDPLRVSARLTALDTDVVLCHSAPQAQDKSNADVTLATPNGAVLASCAYTPYLVTGTQQLWVAANTFPARVSVIIERRTA